MGLRRYQRCSSNQDSLSVIADVENCANLFTGSAKNNNAPGEEVNTIFMMT